MCANEPVQKLSFYPNLSLIHSSAPEATVVRDIQLHSNFTHTAMELKSKINSYRRRAAIFFSVYIAAFWLFHSSLLSLVLSILFFSYSSATIFHTIYSMIAESSTTHLKLITTFLFLLHFPEHVDSDEAKTFFEANYSHIFYILHETFVQAETNLRQRGKLSISP